MRPHDVGRQTIGVSIAVLALVAGVATAQSPPGPPVADGMLRSELALGGRTAVLSYPSDLTTADPARKALVSAVTGSARVRIGQIETTGSLRLGTVDLKQGTPAAGGSEAAGGPSGASAAPASPAAVRYDLWLEGATNGWQLEVTDASATVVGQVPLAREAAAASPTFVAALIPEDITVGRLVLRWGGYQAVTDVQFTNPLRQRAAEVVGVNTTINRRHDEDTSALSRARLLAQRNETALVLPRGQRLSISFERTFARGQRIPGIRNRGLGVEGPDFARLSTTPDGAIVLLTDSSVPRLRNEAPLRFGQTLIATGNQVVSFPGAYGLWLKRVGSGWRLVFNNEPDVWGSQHDPKFDAAEISVTHSEGHASTRPFAVALLPTAADRGRLIIIWGPHEWAADFVAGS